MLLKLLIKLFVQLLCVLTRDVNEELYEFSHHIMAAVFMQMDAMAHVSSLQNYVQSL